MLKYTSVHENYLPYLYKKKKTLGGKNYCAVEKTIFLNTKTFPLIGYLANTETNADQMYCFSTVTIALIHAQSILS